MIARTLLAGAFYALVSTAAIAACDWIWGVPRLTLFLRYGDFFAANTIGFVVGVYQTRRDRR